MRDWFESVDRRTRRIVAAIATVLLFLTFCSPGEEQPTPQGLVSQSPTGDGLAQPLAPPTDRPSEPVEDDTPSAIPGTAQPAEVSFIIDGDTIDVRPLDQRTIGGASAPLIPEGEHRVRLLEIDTPELDDDCYETATDLLAELIPVGTEVLLEPDVEDLDPNDRYLRYVWLPDGTLVNLVMVEEGMATAFIFPLNQAHAGQVLGAEAEAEDLGLGIWGPYCDGGPDMATDLGVPGVSDAEEVARGGFSVVYRARQTTLGRDVAVKVLTARPDPTTLARFQREVAAMVTLGDHPGILQIHDAGLTDDGAPYLVMPFMAAGSVEDRLTAHGGMGWREAVDIGVRMADALATAHAEDVLHRDLKPANLLIDRYGNPVLADFGIARIAGGHQTTSGVITASVAHAAPEVLDGRPPSVASDVYGLASTIYAMATGRPAFVSDTDESLLPLLSRVLTQPMPPVPDAPDGFNDLLHTAMAKDPAERPQSAAEFGRLLAAVAGDPPRPQAAGSAGGASEPSDPEATSRLSDPTPGTFPAIRADRPPAAAGDDPAGAPTGEETAPTARRRGSPIRVVIGVLLLVGVIVAVVVSLTTGDDEAPSEAGDEVVVAEPLDAILAGVDEDPGDLLPIFDPAILSGVDPVVVREAQAVVPLIGAGPAPDDAVLGLPGRTVEDGEALEVSHILVDSEEGAVQARDRILAGEPFEAVAAEVSQDPGSAGDGGRIGPLVRDTFLPEVEDAAIRTAAGMPSEPVETPLGWHIVQTTPAPGAEAQLGFVAVRVEHGADQALRVATASPTGDPFLILFDGDGRFLAADDDNGEGDTGADALVDRVLPEAGEVIIVLGSYGDMPLDVGLTTALMDLQPLQFGVNEGALAPGRQQVAYLVQPTGDEALRLSSDRFDGWLRVSDQAGRVRANARGGVDAIVDLAPLEPDSYLVIAGHDDDDVITAAFELTVSR